MNQSQPTVPNGCSCGWIGDMRRSRWIWKDISASLRMSAEFADNLES
ncbi:hypothetical protein [Paenibacillus marchantiophytorum]|nr:hypothetical protein [Paenibacillus marchantiophytorum]